MDKIIFARITEMPKTMFSPMPQVWVVTCEGDPEQFLFEYYPDELHFEPSDFIGLTLDEARYLKFKRDQEYLRS